MADDLQTLFAKLQKMPGDPGGFATSAEWQAANQQIRRAATAGDPTAQSLAYGANVQAGQAISAMSVTKGTPAYAKAKQSALTAMAQPTQPTTPPATSGAPGTPSTVSALMSSLVDGGAPATQGQAGGPAGAPVAIRSSVEAAGGSVMWDQATGQVIIKGPGGQVAITPDSISGGQSFMDSAALTEAMAKIGLQAKAAPAAAAQEGAAGEGYYTNVGSSIRFNGGVFNLPQSPELGDTEEALDIFRAAGIDPSTMPTETQLQELYQLRVDQQAEQERAVYEHQLERFQANNPNEFAKAKQRINEEAASLKGGYEEQFAASGVFYASTLANACVEVDEKTMEMISDIALEAANKEADLQFQLGQVDKWAIAESAIQKRLASQDYFDQHMKLAQMLSEIQYQHDSLALQEYQADAEIYMGLYDRQLQEQQLEYDRIVKEAGYNALAVWGQTSEILQSALKSNGMLANFQAMDTMGKAAYVDAYFNVIAPYELQTSQFAFNQKMQEAQLALDKTRVANDYSLGRAQLGIAQRELELKENTAKQGDAIKQWTSDYLAGKITDQEAIRRAQSLGIVQPGEADTAETGAQKVLNGTQIIKQIYDSGAQDTPYGQAALKIAADQIRANAAKYNLKLPPEMQDFMADLAAGNTAVPAPEEEGFKFYQVGIDYIKAAIKDPKAALRRFLFGR